MGVLYPIIKYEKTTNKKTNPIMTTLLLKQNKSNHTSSLVTPLIDSEREIAKTIEDLKLCNGRYNAS